MALKENTRLQLVLLFVVVLISRLPFLLPGYGIEEDSWGIALAAEHSFHSGVYEPSRLPGHPVQEIILSALWGQGPWLYNFLSAIFSAVAALFFALILKRYNFRHFILGALAFAFVPVVYISSCYTIDFMWSEALVLISLYLVISRRFIWAGIFLGLAVGCRVTSGAMLVPFMLLVWKRDALSENIRTLFKIGVALALVSVISYLPVYRQFGISFFQYYDQFPYPSLPKVFYKMIPGVFGFIGTLALLLAMFLILKRRSWKTTDHGLDKRIIAASLVVIVLYVVSYFRLPQKSGYMIPVIPYVIILLATWLKEKEFRIICIAMIASAFIFSVNLTDKLRGAEYSVLAVKTTVSGQELFLDPLTGPVFSDRSKRRQKEKYVESLLSRCDTISSPTVLIAGWWYNQIMVTRSGRQDSTVIFQGYCNEVQMQRFNEEGRKIYYLPEQKKYNDLMFRIHSTGRFSTAFEQGYED